ncbi:hypothetical protein RI129_006839 [Pyrocoelia pectoralis]|uniref:Metalloendopeptidase n=1 Tax=Pyrocoelia pectoralis TaxID=417401 RepID=A0AAN7VKC3_9COLE
MNFLTKFYSSNIGRAGGQQTINLAPRCLTPGTIVHEFLHALGFYHQQATTERDDFVTIVWDNILERYKHNFEKHNETVVGSYGEMYDYGSVMHYSKRAFTKNREDTIVPRDPNAEIGQRKGLSVIDIKKLNKMYKK